MSRRNALSWLLLHAGAAFSRAAFFAVNFPALFGPYTRHADVAYGEAPQHRLDVYVPYKSAAARAVVVFWHGGSWKFGDKRDYKFVGAALAGLGCVAVLPNYRHYPEVKMPGFMADAARAAQWAALHAPDYGGDPERLFLMGHSAGAHMAALVTLDPRHFTAAAPPGVPARRPHIAGVIGLSGPYDFLPLQEADIKDMFGPPQLYPESQPINFVHADAPPMLLVHGLKDDRVWPRNSRNLAAALDKLGVAVTLNLFPKLSHTDTVAALSPPLRGRAPILAAIGAFIDAPGNARPPPA
jgi:acetyl esterase/lipase